MSYFNLTTKRHPIETTRLSSKGQIIIPKAVRDAHGWREGTEFTVETEKGGILLRPVKPFPRKTVEEVFGSLKYDGPAKTIEEMNAGVGEAAIEMWKRFEEQ